MKRVVVGVWLCLAAAVGAADDVDKAPASDALPAASPAASPVVRAVGAVSVPAVTAAVPAAAPVVTAAVVSTTPASGSHSASITQSAGEGSDKGAAGDGGPAAARFETAAQWKIAGYNSEEIIYTIVVTSHDSRIIRCNTELKGSY